MAPTLWEYESGESRFIKREENNHVKINRLTITSCLELSSVFVIVE